MALIVFKDGKMVIRLLMLPADTLKLIVPKEKTHVEDGNRLHVRNRKIMFVERSIMHNLIAH